MRKGAKVGNQGDVECSMCKLEVQLWGNPQRRLWIRAKDA